MEKPTICFNCKHWKADLNKLVLGKCYKVDPPKPRTANDTCILWEEAEPVKFE